MSTKDTVAARSAAFFDELSDIVESRIRDKDSDYRDDADRPYDSLLTQDEEPVIARYYEAHNEEPEVLTRFGYAGHRA